MILLIDNYDSFVFNLARYFERLGKTTLVVRNDAIDAQRVRQIRPEAIVLSPGPCTPFEAGCSLDVVRRLYTEFPILGVCLGHQALGMAFGGLLVRATEPWHGRTSPIGHDQTGVFTGVPNPLTVCRYHSLVLDEGSLPKDLTVTARTKDGIVMALAHRTYPLVGVQFHPESILTESGYPLLANFLNAAGVPGSKPIPSLADELATTFEPCAVIPQQPVTF